MSREARVSRAGRVGRGAASDLIVYVAARGILLVMSCLPRAAGLRIGAALGRLLFALLPGRRAVALANLERAFGDRLPADERARIARAAFAHLGMIGADAAYFPRLLRRPIEGVAAIEGLEHLRSAAAAGRGVLVFSGHFGHWEMIALVQPRLGHPFAMVVRPLNNPYMDRLLARLRRRAGNVLIPKREAARGVLRALRDGRAVALLIDQNVRGEGGVFVDFFGTPASTTPALATFAFKTGAPIVPVFADLGSDGRVAIRYLPPIHARRSGALQDDILALMRRCTGILEAEIRRRPDSWFWMHDRWRTRPAAGAGPRTAAAPGGGAETRAGGAPADAGAPEPRAGDPRTRTAL